MKKNHAGFARRGEREGIPAEGFALWCRIGDLSDACGYDASADGARLRELPDAYPARPAGIRSPARRSTPCGPWRP